MISIHEEENVDGILELIEKNSPDTKKFNFTPMHLSLAQMQRLHRALKSNTHVKSVSFYRGVFNADSLKELADALKTNTAITSLDLCYNYIDSDGAQHIADALKTNTALISLNLQGTRIRKAGIKAIAEALKKNKTLTTLNLSSNPLYSEDIKGRHEVFQALLEALTANKTLTSLNLSDESLRFPGPKYIAEALKENKTLISLDLQRNNIMDEDMEIIEKAIVRNQARRLAVSAPIMIETAFREANKGNPLVNSIIPLLPAIMEHAAIEPNFVPLQKLRAIQQSSVKLTQGAETKQEKETQRIVQQPSFTRGASSDSASSTSQDALSDDEIKITYERNHQKNIDEKNTGIRPPIAPIRMQLIDNDDILQADILASIRAQFGDNQDEEAAPTPAAPIFLSGGLDREAVREQRLLILEPLARGGSHANAIASTSTANRNNVFDYIYFV